MASNWENENQKEHLVTYFIILDAIKVFQVMKTGDINIEQVEQNKNKNSSLITMVDALINVMNMNTSNTEQTSEEIITLTKHALNQG